MNLQQMLPQSPPAVPLTIIINLGYPMGVMLVNGIPSAGLRRRVVSRRVISVISEKGQKACRGKRCVIIYELGHW